MDFPYVVFIDLSYFFWWCCCSCCLESDHFWKLIHYDHYCIFVIWFWQWSNNINANFLLWFLKCLQWIKFFYFFHVLHFVLLIFLALLNILLDIILYFWLPVVSFVVLDILHLLVHDFLVGFVLKSSSFLKYISSLVCKLIHCPSMLVHFLFLTSPALLVS